MVLRAISENALMTHQQPPLQRLLKAQLALGDITAAMEK